MSGKSNGALLDGRERKEDDDEEDDVVEDVSIIVLFLIHILPVIGCRRRRWDCDAGSAWLDLTTASDTC